MDRKKLAREVRKQRRLEALGSNNPICGTCGETDWRCLEGHHPAGEKHDALTVPTCRNCHRKVTDDQKDHPPHDPGADAELAGIGHFLMGLGDLHRLAGEKLSASAAILIERATNKGREQNP